MVCGCDIGRGLRSAAVEAVVAFEETFDGVPFRQRLTVGQRMRGPGTA